MIGNLSLFALMATATAATALPDPKSPEALGWWVIVAVAVLVGVDKALDFYKKHVREQPTPSTTYLTIPNFEKCESERKADREKILNKLDELSGKIEDGNRYQAKARQGIHRRQNRMENALSYIAGCFHRNGDAAAATAIEQKLHAGGNDGGEYGE